VHAEPRGATMPLRIEAPKTALSRVRLRWRRRCPSAGASSTSSGSAAYGDLEWRGMLGERVLPWYFLGVRRGGHARVWRCHRGGASFAFWQVDPQGISLWIDVRNGGGAVQLGERVLEAATIMTRRGRREESRSNRAPVLPHALRQAEVAPRSRCTAGTTGITRTAGIARRRTSIGTRL